MGGSPNVQLVISHLLFADHTLIFCESGARANLVLEGYFCVVLDYF